MIFGDHRNRIINLIINRFLNNSVICTNYNVNKEEVLKDFAKQEELFYRIFPAQVESGDRKSTTIDWMINRITDGNGIYTPREIIHFLQELRNEQLQKISRGEDNSVDEKLFGTNIFKDAFKTVSIEKFTKVLLSEYKDARDYLLLFEGRHAEYGREKLYEVITDGNKEEVANKLCSIGFFNYIKTTDSFKIPFIYQPCLNIILGKE
jgi:hypothetical protein